MVSAIKTMFLDVGGVLLTNGWDRGMRKRAIELFQLDLEEVNERHHLTFDAYEQGSIPLQEYLDRVIFYEPRPFTHEQFWKFMIAQSTPIPEMIDLIRQLKTQHQLKIATVSNEGRELTLYRMHRFGLTEFVDVFVSSCFVRCRKPDPQIFRMALDLTQSAPEATVYLDDRPMFVEIAQSLGLHGIHHINYESTRDALAELGLALEVVSVLEVAGVATATHLGPW